MIGHPPLVACKKLHPLLAWAGVRTHQTYPRSVINSIVLLLQTYLSQNQNRATSFRSSDRHKSKKNKSKMLAPAPNTRPVYRTPVTSPVRRRIDSSSIPALRLSCLNISEVDETNCYVTPPSNSSANPPAITSSSRDRYMISPTAVQELSAPMLPELRRHHSPPPIRRTRLPLKARNQGLFHVGNNGGIFFEDFY